MSKLEPLEELRPLGRLERFHVNRYAIGFYNNVAVTGRYCVPALAIEDAGTIEALIYPIVRRIIPRHPSMGIGVFNQESKNPSWKRLNRIDLKDVVQIIDEDQLNRFLEEGHAKLFDRVTELPLWRVIIGHAKPKPNSPDHGKDVDLIVGFFFHHAIGDGGSGAAFHMDFSELLNTKNPVEDRDPANSIVEVPASKLLPSIEEVKDFNLSYWKIATVLYGAFFPSNNPSLWSGKPITAPEAGRPKTRIATLNLPAATAAKINLACREKSMTVTPFLAVTIIKTLANIYPDYTEFTCNIPVSFRKFTGVGIRAMVDHFSNTTLFFSTASRPGHFPITRDEKVDCDVVRSCKTQITEAASSPKNSNIATLSLLNDYVDWLKKEVGKKRGQSIEVSNLGLVDLQDDAPDTKSKCTSLTLSQSANVTGGAFSIGVAAVKNGDLSISVTWQEGIVEEEDAKEFMNMLEERLLRVAV